jgi:lysophospholipase L1-like esterase
VTLGDSIAAGEGNPAVPGENPAWPNRRCHRSTTAASQRAMAAYEQGHRRESITFVNLACSGAKLSNMLLGGEAYAGIEPDGTFERPQLAQLQEIIARTGRTPDVVYLSGGANDLGFADITTSCLDISSAWETAKCATLNPLVKAGDELLVGPRPALDLAPTNFEAGRFAALRRDFTAMGIDNSKVVVSQYPNPTRGDNGAFCPEIVNDTPLWVIGKRIYSTDVMWAGDPKVGPVAVLNQDVATAAARNGWKLVPGIATDFDTHGYCASGTWINTYTFSMANQGNKTGMLHPNNAGTNNYSRRIQESIAANGLL